MSSIKYQIDLIIQVNANHFHYCPRYYQLFPYKTGARDWHPKYGHVLWLLMKSYCFRRTPEEVEGFEERRLPIFLPENFV
jgi:hypothetical protein